MYKVKVTTFYVLHFRFIFIYFLNVTISSDRVGYVSTAVPQLECLINLIYHQHTGEQALITSL